MAAGLTRKYMGTRCIGIRLKLDSEFAFSLDFITPSERRTHHSAAMLAAHEQLCKLCMHEMLVATGYVPGT